jgi:hypothetical protein
MRPFAMPAALLLALSTPAAAATITVSFTATIDEVGSEVASAFTLGDTINGSIQIDGATPDSAADASIGFYSGAIDDLSFSFGSYLASASVGQVNVANAAIDTFVATTSNATGASVGGLALVNATLNLVDSDGSALSTDAIPLSLLLSDFGTARASIFFEGGTPSRRVGGNLSSLTLSVPEPGALALLGLIGLARAARWGR